MKPADFLPPSETLTVKRRIRRFTEAVEERFADGRWQRTDNGSRSAVDVVNEWLVTNNMQPVDVAFRVDIHPQSDGHVRRSMITFVVTYLPYAEWLLEEALIASTAQRIQASGADILPALTRQTAPSVPTTDWPPPVI